MRWIKRLLVGVAVLLLALVLLSVTGLWMGSDYPDYLRIAPLSPEQQKAAATRVVQAWGRAQNYIIESQGDEVRSPNAGTTQPQAPAERQPVRLSFTAGELNVSFQQWAKDTDIDSRISNYLKEPRIVLHDGRLIFAGQVKNMGILDDVVASVHFEPRINEQGNLDLHLVKVLGGRLSLPDAAWSKYREKLTGMIHDKLPDLQRRAEIDQYGDANAEAVTAAASRLLVEVLNREPSEPVIFVTVADKRDIPVKLTHIAVEQTAPDDEQHLVIEVQAMTPGERMAFLDRLRNTDVRLTAIE